MFFGLSFHSMFFVIMVWLPLNASLMPGLRFLPAELGKTGSKYCLSLVIVGRMSDGLRVVSEFSLPFT